MSRVAKNPITIPDSLTLSIENNVVKVKGSKGEIDFDLPSSVSLEVNENIISTNQGLMTDRDAKAKNVGGEILCEVF